MSKKRKPLDIKELKEATTEAKQFESLDFLFPKHPEGDMSFAYQITPTQEPREFTSKKGYTYQCVDAVINDVKNDPDVKAGEKRTVILHDVLYKQLMEQAPITGKAFNIMGKGKVTSKKTGRQFYDFAVILAETTLEAFILQERLPPEQQ